METIFSVEHSVILRNRREDEDSYNRKYDSIWQSEDKPFLRRITTVTNPMDVIHRFIILGIGINRLGNLFGLRKEVSRIIAAMALRIRKPVCGGLNQGSFIHQDPDDFDQRISTGGEASLNILDFLQLNQGWFVVSKIKSLYLSRKDFVTINISEQTVCKSLAQSLFGFEGAKEYFLITEESLGSND